jgi:hypothetical protein
MQRSLLGEARVICLRRMFRYSTSVLVSLLIVCSVRPQGQNQGTTIRVNVDLVSVSARVTDKQGRDVSGLTADGFALFEDGRRQRISFLDTEKEPISLSILVDSSSSMNADDKLGAAQGMLEELISRSRLDDAVSVLQFTDHVVGFKLIAREQRLLTIPMGITSRRICGRPAWLSPMEPTNTAGSGWNN